MLPYEDAQSMYMFRKTKHSSGNVESVNQSAEVKHYEFSTFYLPLDYKICFVTLPLNLTSFTVSSTKYSACPNSNLHASILAFVVPINPASGQCCLNITALQSGNSSQI